MTLYVCMVTKYSNNFKNFLDESIYKKETKHVQNKQTTRDEKRPASDVFQYGERKAAPRSSNPPRSW